MSVERAVGTRAKIHIVTNTNSSPFADKYDGRAVTILEQPGDAYFEGQYWVSVDGLGVNLWFSHHELIDLEEEKKTVTEGHQPTFTSKDLHALGELTERFQEWIFGFNRASDYVALDNIQFDLTSTVGDPTIRFAIIVDDNKGVGLVSKGEV